MDEQAEQWKELCKNSPLKRYTAKKIEEMNVEKKGGEVPDVAPMAPRQHTVTLVSIEMEDVPTLVALVITDHVSASIGSASPTVGDFDDKTVRALQPSRPRRQTSRGTRAFSRLSTSPSTHRQSTAPHPRQAESSSPGVAATRAPDVPVPASFLPRAGGPLNHRRTRTGAADR
ncbi:hypothetical protein GUJ93_ZPchr0013g34293 [Zizania palustris]|uniref:Uncharacterized protein n=1 Tax=Zizania palustris TaxID=103762 RepID=A0A8J5X8I9_ZIZPA|nr:hypothetical protein GUJ93_ZPchr0013g34293 [Zizania palustris]